MSATRARHHTVIWVRTSPLRGIGSLRTTSNGLMRSVATMSSRSSPASYTSRTLPRATSGRSRFVVLTAADMDSGPQFRRFGARSEAGEERLDDLGEEFVHLVGRSPEVLRRGPRFPDHARRQAAAGGGEVPLPEMVRFAP